MCINTVIFLSSQLWYDLSGRKFHLGGQTIHVATPLNMVTFYYILTDKPFFSGLVISMSKAKAEGDRMRTVKLNSYLQCISKSVRDHTVMDNSLS